MRPYIKIYLNFFGFSEGEVICENCKSPANDIHHCFFKGMGGRKTFRYEGEIYDISDIINLIGLCRDCHNKAHRSELTKEYLMLAHKIYMKQNGI